MTGHGKRVSIVFNPASGGGRGLDVSRALLSELEARGWEVEDVPTSPERDVFATLDVAGRQAVCVLGGDGTIHAAANSLADRTVPVAFLGVGTINVLSRELSLPRDPAAFAAMVDAGRTMDIPLLGVGARHGVLFAECGLLGGVVTRVNELRERRGRHGKIEFVLVALGRAFTSFGRPLRLAVDGARPEATSQPEATYSNVLFTKARRYAGTMPMPIDPAITCPLAEREFEIVASRSLTPLGHLLLLAVASLGLLPRLAGLFRRVGLLHTFRGKHAVVSADSVPGVHVDAETLEASFPLEVTVSSESLRLIVPA